MKSLIERLIRFLEAADILELRCAIYDRPVAYDNADRHRNHFHRV